MANQIMQTSFTSFLGILASAGMLIVQQANQPTSAQQPATQPSTIQQPAERPDATQPGQTQPDRRLPGDAERPRPGMQRERQLDAQLAAWLALCNHAEIELGKLAIEKSQDAEVRKFAQQMIDEHTEYLAKLRPFMPALDERTPGDQRDSRPTTRPGEAAARPGADPDRPVARPADNANDNQPRDPSVTPGQADVVQPRAGLPGARVAGQDDQPRRPGQQPGEQPDGSPRVIGAGPGGIQAHSAMLRVAHQAAKNKLSMTKQLLEQKEGRDFDKCYLGQQILAHIEMVSTLHAMKDHGSQRFQTVAEEGLETAEQHLNHARQLAQRLENDEDRPTPTGARSTNPRSNSND